MDIARSADAVTPRRLDGQPLADRAERIAIDGARRLQFRRDRFSHMRQLHRTAGQEHRVDITSLEAGLLETNVDPRLDAGGETLGMTDQILASDAGFQALLDPVERDARFRLL